MNANAPTIEQWVPEVLVRLYRGEQLIEQQFSDNPEAIGKLIESWEADAAAAGAVIVAEPHPPEAIVALLRAIADAIEKEQPVAMPRPFPHIRLQLTIGNPEREQLKVSDLRLLRQELAHPGG